jgi:hypothetical protein
MDGSNSFTQNPTFLYPSIVHPLSSNTCHHFEKKIILKSDNSEPAPKNAHQFGWTVTEFKYYFHWVHVPVLTTMISILSFFFGADPFTL